MSSSLTRKPYLDTMKLVAIFVVFTTHFIACFNERYFVLWRELPTSLVLKGVTGKLGVVIFCVILGYCAYHSSEQSIAVYTIKRYVYFVICGLFINSVYALFASFEPLSDSISIQQVLRTSFLLDDSIYPTFWCIKPFMLASFISKVNGKAQADSITLVIEIIMLIAVKQEWVAICILGNLVASNENSSILQPVFRKRIIRIGIYLLMFVCVKFTNSNYIYTMDGILVALVMVALNHSTHLIRLLNNKLLSSIGKNTMAIYMLHVIVYQLVGKHLINSSNYIAMFIIAFILSWITIVAISFPTTRILSSINHLCGNYIDRAYNFLAGLPEKLED